MRHRKAKLQFNRFTSWRKATLASLARNLLIHQSIRTTKTKAKAVRPLLEKLISLSKENTLAARRQAYKILKSHQLVNLLFGDIGRRFASRLGGSVRMIQLGQRSGDNASMVILQLTEIKQKEVKKPKAQPQEKPQEQKIKPGLKVIEKPTVPKRPSRSFLGGIRKIFKKERKKFVID